MDAAKLGAWAPLLNQDTLAPLLARTQAARKTAEIYPPAGRELFALTQTPPERVRAVILGQDPYHEPGQAMGLAFSVAPGTVFPPSLCNIFRELTDDVGVPAPASGDLTAWAQRGVLLLNTVLTVERGKAASHAGWGRSSRTTSSAQRTPCRSPLPSSSGARMRRKRPHLSARTHRACS